MVLVATLIRGWFLLLPEDFAALGNQATLGLSNFHFLAQVNYFSLLSMMAMPCCLTAIT